MSNDTTTVGPNPSGLCMCGCGRRTELAAYSCQTRGWVKGAPVKYRLGHSNRKVDPTYTNARGYRIMHSQMDSVVRVQREHRVIWEAANGSIPNGHYIHHVDGNKGNNAIENLACVDPTYHNRIHRGWKFINGEWMKPCNTCCSILPTGEFHRRSSGGFVGECRECKAARDRAAYAARRNEAAR